MATTTKHDNQDNSNRGRFITEVQTLNSLKVKIRPNKGKFIVDYVDPIDGRKRSQFCSYAQAIVFKDEVEDNLSSGKKNILSNRSIAELMEMHLDDCPNTLVMRRKNHFLSFMDRFGNMKLKDLDVYDLNKWFLAQKENDDLSFRTLNHVKANFNHFFKYLVDKNALFMSPLVKLKYERNPPPRRPRVYMTQDEVKSILENAKLFSPEFLYPYFYGLVHTGARRSELIKLKWSNVDFNRRVVIFVDTKTGTNRAVKMSDPLFNLLKEKQRTSEYVFVNPDQEQISRGQLQRYLVSFKHSYPIDKDWTCHAFRHSFAYNFLKNAGKMYQLQAILGHKSIHQTVDHYGRLHAEDIEDPSPYKF